MTAEVWKPVPVAGLVKFYEVSNLGRVRRTETGRVLTNSRGGAPGYERAMVTMCRPGFQSGYHVAALVLAAFGTSNRYGRRIGFVDGNPMNCALTNVFWRADEDACPPFRPFKGERLKARSSAGRAPADGRVVIDETRDWYGI